MRLWISKPELDFAEAMQSEGRTRSVVFTTFPMSESDVVVVIEE
jgi:hypothetical protein